MLLYDNTLWLLIAALLLDAVIGDPDWLWRRLPHPVVWIGKVISGFDTGLNRPAWSAATRRTMGVLTLIVLVTGGIVFGLGLQQVAATLAFGDLLVVLIAAVFLAQKSLYQHVAAVRDGLRDNGLEGGRKAVAMIVGRDPKSLDEAGVSRAAIESCAENYSDGIVAPLIWFALLGLPGLITYKAVNTADSMIGHKNEKYSDFGWASARFDDVINLPASRLAGVFLALSAPMAGGSTFRSFKAILNDAKKHRSPNAGRPEAAMAGALGLALAGPRKYPGYTVDDPYMNATGRRQANAQDISRSLRLLLGAYGIEALLVLILAFAFSPF
ncbi:adenosylcobinamide-phosphate synthase CbiB [Labrenzia sp. PHM005]|uniref:adenosylcobinamide-phosphate synthase CbiB n=1 Tax=Labrenzia sp. PHM005 TaxID=2590016 RepID=UPI00113FE475|nr:adenosylcobinamide-phosphate synthase CbiB [Labrenzia sp. PHM005]QDG77531.1 cobalamin biosynthesis protein [Labrenzia sp. PHM005]